MNSKEIPGTVYPLQSCLGIKTSMQPSAKDRSPVSGEE
jgi:hypothetical protein